VRLAALRGAVGRLIFDVARGIETTNRVSHEALGFVGSERVNYRPTGWGGLRRIFASIPISADDVFVDFGSGKGRVVLEAARHPFRRVVGVEVSSELHELAKRNLQQFRPRRRCGSVELVCRDVLDYEIPDDMTVAYLFNPFRGEVFAAFVERLLASLERSPRRVTVVYVNPVEEQALLAAGATLVERIWGREGRSEAARSHSIVLYELLTPDK
jgi:SAM-dependent methyltransferase